VHQAAAPVHQAAAPVHQAAAPVHQAAAPVHQAASRSSTKTAGKRCKPVESDSAGLQHNKRARVQQEQGGDACDVSTDLLDDEVWCGAHSGWQKVVRSSVRNERAEYEVRFPHGKPQMVPEESLWSFHVRALREMWTESFMK
jgi:hypothetical protein